MTANNMATVVVASLFLFACGSGNGIDGGQSNDGGVTDAGPDAMPNDGDVMRDSDVMLDGGCVWTRENPCDAGPMIDAGTDSAVTADGGACVPTRENPLCTGADSCECDMSWYAGLCTPDRCAPGPGRNECVPGVSNRCGWELPTRVDSYRYSEW